MARSDAAALLASTGLPIVYSRWPVGVEPTYPYIRYIRDGANDFNADNTKYWKVDVWTATLVSERKDDASEQAIEAAFEAAGIAYDPMGDYPVDSERLHQADYRFELPR